MKPLASTLAIFAMAMLPWTLTYAGTDETFPVPDEVPGWVKDVIQDPTFVRFAGPVRIPTRMEVYDRLLDHLPLSSDLSRDLGLGEYSIVLQDGVAQVDDGHGATAVLEELYRAPGHRIFAGAGCFSLPVLPDVTGRGVVEVRYEMDGEVLVSHARLSFQIDGRVYATLTRLSMPVVEDMVDERLLSFVNCANVLSEKIAHDALGLCMQIRDPGTAEQFRTVFREEMRVALAATRRNS